MSPRLAGIKAARSEWPVPVEDRCRIRTLRRHVSMRRKRHRSGAQRQSTNLHHNQHVAPALAAAIDYQAERWFRDVGVDCREPSVRSLHDVGFVVHAWTLMSQPRSLLSALDSGWIV